MNPSVERDCDEKENTRPKFNHTGSLSTRRSGSLAPLGHSKGSFGIVDPHAINLLNKSRESFPSQEDKDSVGPAMGRTITRMEQPVVIPQTP